MKKALVLIALVATGACAKGRPQLTPADRAFVVVPPTESGIVENEDEMDITIPAFDPAHGAGSAEQLEARFRGVDRKTPKTTIAQAPRKTFSDLAALVATLADDAAMVHHTPDIERDTMTRAVEERRNVRVPAWIYAIKYESDQDWHVIVGTDPAAAGPRTLFNAEVSGLPPSSAVAFDRLHDVRQQLADLLGDALPAGSSYHKLTHPIGVVIEGSLFFDVDHAAGVVGPAGLRPDTAWEIHPVTKLRLR